LIATQSPGDIDYKAIGQFSTFILGTLNTKQDIEKVKKRLESVAPKEIDYITGKLPALKPGNFLTISPDEFSDVQQMKVRWLVTQHKVISEKQIVDINSSAVSDYYNKVINKRSEQVSKEGDTKPNKQEQTQKVTAKTKNDEQIIVVKNMIMERFLSKEVRSLLKGRLFKLEKLISSEFIHLPLIQVAVTFFEKRGIFKKTITEIPENLYLDYKDHKMVHVQKDHFVFSSVINRDPHKIDDLDNFCTLIDKNKDDVDFDFRSLGKKINKSNIIRKMERKYNLKVNDVKLALFPTWKCTLENKKTKETRDIHLDGIFANFIENKV